MSECIPTDVLIAQTRNAVAWTAKTHGVAKPVIVDPSLLADLANRLAIYDAALRVIEGRPSDSGPWIEVYREAGGGYEGLQAIAGVALGRRPVRRAPENPLRREWREAQERP